jgi:hypothetical protein
MRMWQKPASGVLARSRPQRTTGDWLWPCRCLSLLRWDGDSHQAEGWQSPSLTATLLGGLFQHPLHPCPYSFSLCDRLTISHLQGFYNSLSMGRLLPDMNDEDVRRSGGSQLGARRD